MFTSAFLSALLQMAIPAIISITSLGMSKYLEKKDKPELALLIKLASLGGMFIFYLLPQLDHLADGLTQLLIPPTPNPTLNTDDTPTFAIDFDNAYSFKPEVTCEQVAATPPPPDVKKIDMLDTTTPFDSKQILDYSHQEFQKMHHEANEMAKRLLRPTIEEAAKIQTVNYPAWAHLDQWAKASWQVFVDIISK
jgi:hypothetical protein